MLWEMGEVQETHPAELPGAAEAASQSGHLEAAARPKSCSEGASGIWHWAKAVLVPHPSP